MEASSQFSPFVAGDGRSGSGSANYRACRPHPEPHIFQIHLTRLGLLTSCRGFLRTSFKPLSSLRDSSNMPESDIPMTADGRKLGTEITGLLSELNNYLSDALENLKSQVPGLGLQDDDHLPDPETSNLAARAVDLTHQIQLLLDPPVLILADHFLGTYIETTISQ